MTSKSVVCFSPLRQDETPSTRFLLDPFAQSAVKLQLSSTMPNVIEHRALLSNDGAHTYV